MPLRGFLRDDELVRWTVEETLNTCLDAEADAPYGARCYDKRVAPVNEPNFPLPSYDIGVEQ